LESTLKDLSARLQAVIDTALDGIMTINTRGIVETMNNSAATLFGYDREEVIGNNISMLMPDPDRSSHDGYLERYQKTRVPHIIGIGREVFGLKKNGETFPFRLAVSEVILNDRIIFTGIIHDTTEIHNAHKKLETKVEERTEELEKTINLLKKSNSKLEENENLLTSALLKEKELNELKSRFVTMASHEFKTPLSTILSSASLISKYQTDDTLENRERHVGKIKSAVQNLTGILNDFLSLSRIEEGLVKVVLEKFDLSILLDSVVSELKHLTKGGKKIQTVFLSENTIVKSDKRIIKNLLFNLMSNALKYSLENGVVECKVEFVNQDLKIEVTDHGIGIPESDQKYLFQRFFRAGNVQNIEGTGLGLHIVKGYVDLLKGTISFQSIQNSHTTFEVIIPISHE